MCKILYLVGQFAEEKEIEKKIAEGKYQEQATLEDIL
jgi:hypothetical protein